MERNTLRFVETWVWLLTKPFNRRQYRIAQLWLQTNQDFKRPSHKSVYSSFTEKKKDISLKCNKNIHVCKWCLILRQGMRVRKSKCKKKHDILMFPLMFLSCSVFICQRKLHGAMLSTCPCSQNTVFVLTSLK